MPWFLTSYYANWRRIEPDEELSHPGKYGAYLWAPSKRSAQRTAKIRGMGEIIVSCGFKAAPYKRASTILRSKKSTVHEQYHALCYLGMIAMASGAASAQQIIGDEGIIHERCHASSLRKLAERVRSIEAVTPGYWINK